MGLLAGALARSVAGSPRRGCLFTIAVGVAGALIGGAIAQAAGQQGVNEFSWWSLLVSFSGATVLLIALSALDRGS
jgi:uncharacterized membrane protein YeaQ/YmgE (transglycosylase-associated protein family)